MYEKEENDIQQSRNARYSSGITSPAPFMRQYHMCAAIENQNMSQRCHLKACGVVLDNFWTSLSYTAGQTVFGIRQVCYDWINL
jgi:hypothetical protein